MLFTLQKTMLVMLLGGALSAYAAPSAQSTAKMKPKEELVYRLNFASPSKNIVCGGDVRAKYGGAKGVSCYIVNKSNANPLTAKPKSCKDNWGNVFELAKTGMGGLGCYADTPYSQNPVILPYGKSIRGSGWTCTSEMSGMKCVNSDRHGFEIGRQQQSFF